MCLDGLDDKADRLGKIDDNSDQMSVASSSIASVDTDGHASVDQYADV